MIVLDSSFLYALLEPADQFHGEAAAWYERAEEPDLATTPLAVAEIDFLARRSGPRAAAAFRSDLAAGAYDVEWSQDLLAEALEVAGAHHDLGLPLTDASLVALAARRGTVRIATFDERHFRALRPLSGEPAFELLPRDA